MKGLSLRSSHDTDTLHSAGYFRLPNKLNTFAIHLSKIPAYLCIFSHSPGKV